MAIIKKYLLVILVAFVALVLVGCKPDVPELPAPTELTIVYDIYDGTEKDPYLLVGNDMYLSAEVNEGADSKVNWSLASTDRAELLVEDGVAIITGKAAGNIEVTCASVKDPSVSAKVVVEVVVSEDFNAILTGAITQIKSELPEYVDGDFELPKLDNQNIKLTYLSKGKDVWADGIFKYEYEGLDIEYQFYAQLSYHGIVVDTILQVKVVSDVNDNSFISIGKAQKIVDDFMAKYTNDVEDRVLNETVEGFVVGEAWNATNLPALLLPTSTTAEETGEPIRIWWEQDKVVGGTLVLKEYRQVDKDTQYYLTYEKNDIDTTHVLTAFFQLGDKLIKNVYRVTCDGYEPEEIVAYYIEQGYAIESPYTLTKTFVSVSSIDKTKKFPKITVEYTVEDESIVKLTEVTDTDSSGSKYVSGYRIQGLKNGETVVTATFYCGKTITEQEVLDESGSVVVDPETNLPVKETVVTYVYKYEYVIPFTVNR